MPSEMNAPQANDAQRDLEQRALRNVRGLVDKMEGIDASDLARQRRYMTAIVGTAVAFAVALGIALWFSSSHSSSAVVIDSSKAAKK